MRGYKHTVSPGFSAINAKTLKVEFNKAVTAEDQAKVTFETKRGTIGVSLTVKWAEDGKSVELAQGSNLIAGDYTVTVKGLELAVDSATVTVEAVKATTLTVKSTILNDETSDAKINVSLADQYGEDMVLVKDDFTPTAFNVTQSKKVDLEYNNTGKYFYINTVTVTGQPDNFKANDVVKVTFLHNKTGLQATAELTVVAGAYVDTITFGDIELPKGKDLLTCDLKDVKVPYVAKDQFDNVIKLDAGNVTIVSSDQDILKPINVEVNVVEEKVTKIKIKSFEPKDGTVTLTLVGNASGNAASLTLDVLKAPGEIANVTVLDPSITVAAKSDGYVGLEVTDMYGKVIEAKDYAAALKFVSSNPDVVSNDSAPTVETTGTNAGKVKVTVLENAKKDATATISVNFDGKQVASFTVKAGEKADPTTVAIKADSKHKTTLAKGASTTVIFEAVDQYGNKITTDVEGYTISCKVKDNNDNIKIAIGDGTKTSLGDAKVALSAEKVGSATLVVELKKGEDLKDTKEINFTVVANESTAGITIAAIPNLYKGGKEAYQEPVKVETADGIALPVSSIMSVTSNSPAVVIIKPEDSKGWLVKGSEDGLNTDKNGSKIDTKATITVIYNADDKPITLTQEVTVLAADLKAEALIAYDKALTGKGVPDKDAKQVSTINVANFMELLNEQNTDKNVYLVVKDNFGRYSAATTEGDDPAYTDVELAIANVTGFVENDSDEVLKMSDGVISFSNIAEILTSADTKKASFRILAMGGGLVKDIAVNITDGLEINASLPTFTATEPAELTVTTVPNSYKDEMVRAHFELEDGVTLEYKEGGEGEWIELVDVFGPDTGFPLDNITTTFQATFNNSGPQSVTVEFKGVGESSKVVYGSKTITANVLPAPEED